MQINVTGVISIKCPHNMHSLKLNRNIVGGLEVFPTDGPTNLRNTGQGVQINGDN
jgi:hypothetical protein